MRLLVEISQGLGNCVQGTPLLRALWLMGHSVDLYINSPLAEKLKPLWQGWDVLDHIYTHHDQFSARDYDFGVSGYGRRQLVRMFPPGLCLKVEKRHVRRQSETEANVEAARWLGYSGPTPASYAQAAMGDYGCGPSSVVVHAGCDPANAIKRWPHWPEVCARLRGLGRHVVVVGTAPDRSGWEDAFDARFGLTLPELMAVLRHSGAYLGNDSGVGHLACAALLPGLMLYGPSNPVKNAPNSSVMRMLVAPAKEGEQRDVGAAAPVDIARLGLEQVWAEIETMLANPQREAARELPPRLNDGPDLRWQHFVASTIAQAEPEGVSMRANLPATAPRVSVVIPTFNRAQNALRAVRSALAQTEASLEVLLVDDGSSDETPQLFSELPQRVAYIRKPNGGASSARNAGLRRARGEWVALLDSDDEWAPDKLARQLEAMGHDYVSAACRHVHVNEDGSRQTKPERLPGRDHHLFRDLYAKLSLKTSSLVFKRHLLERTGLFHERFPIANDWDFFLRLARVVNNSGMLVLPQALVTVHRSKDSISKSGRANALEEALTRICMINGLLHSEDTRQTQRHIRRAGRKHLELSRACRKQGEKDKAASHAREAVRAGLHAEGIWRWLQSI